MCNEMYQIVETLDNIYVGESSAVLIEAIFDRHLWNEIWTKLQETFDCENPVPNKSIVEMRKELFPRLENYAQTCTTLCKLPLSHGEMSAIQPSGKFSAYHYCKDPKRIDISIFLDNDYVVTKLNTVTLECKRVLNPQKDNFIRKIFIQSNTKGNY